MDSGLAGKSPRAGMTTRVILNVILNSKAPH
jgi:hypothetical protein